MINSLYTLSLLDKRKIRIKSKNQFPRINLPYMQILSVKIYEVEIIMENKKKEMRSELPYAALDEVPNPKSDAKEIVGLVKSRGKISGYQLSDGSTVSKEEGVSMAKSGDIRGVGVAHRRDSEYLKSLPDGTEGNNLSSLPSISKSELSSKAK